MRHLVPLLVLSVAGCASDSSSDPVPRFDIPEAQAKIFQEADTWTLVATDPRAPNVDEIPEENFHGYRILGQVDVSDVDLRAELVRELNAGIRANDGRVAACFDPRHALRATTDEGTAELLICFACLQIYVYDGPEGERTKSVLTSETPKHAFTRIFESQGLEVDPGWH